VVIYILFWYSFANTHKIRCFFFFAYKIMISREKFVYYSLFTSRNIFQFVEQLTDTKSLCTQVLHFVQFQLTLHVISFGLFMNFLAWKKFIHSFEIQLLWSYVKTTIFLNSCTSITFNLNLNIYFLSLLIKYPHIWNV